MSAQNAIDLLWWLSALATLAAVVVGLSVAEICKGHRQDLKNLNDLVDRKQSEIEYRDALIREREERRKRIQDQIQQINEILDALEAEE